MKPLPTPSAMTWADVHRILEGELPPPSKTLPALEDYNTVDDATLNLFITVLEKNFRKTTEMEAVMCVGVIVLFAVKGLDIEIQLQPCLENHPTFTDFLFVMRGSAGKIRGFIEVKNASLATDLGSQTTATAQTLREAQIALSKSDKVALPFILTNSHNWSIGVAEKRSEDKVAITSIHSFLLVQDRAEWKRVISCVRALLSGTWCCK